MRYKSCYCHMCEKSFHSLGIARHRAMHRDRCERVSITFGDDTCRTWDFTRTPVGDKGASSSTADTTP